MGTICKIFGHRYRCSMGFMSVCIVCGDVYDYNVKVCGICGGKLEFKKGKLFCKEKKCVNLKMSKKDFDYKLFKAEESNGIIYNYFKNRKSLEIKK